MIRVIGYEGEGPVKRAIYSENVPAVGRVTGMVAGATARGFVALGGTLVYGESTEDRDRRMQREAMKRKRIARRAAR